MSCEAATADLLRAFGLRLTHQRESIISALRHTDDHRTAQTILDQVQAEHPSVNASTVYRTLTLFKQLGLVSETDLGTGELSYAWLGTDRHHHLICHRCGGVIELGHDYMRSLQKTVMRDFGFAATIDHFAIFGICIACRSGSEA